MSKTSLFKKKVRLEIVLDEPEKMLLEKVALKSGKTISEFLRDFIRSLKKSDK